MKTTKLLLLLVPIILVACLSMVVGEKSRLKGQDRSTDQPQTSKVQPQTKTATEAYVPGLPVRLVIPKINVNAAIESLGLTADGDLDAPKNIINAGWYNAGPRAGSQGSVVIDGHFGAVDGKSAVFDSLHTLQKGDLLYVEDGNGGTHTYTVRETRLFQPNEDTSIVFRSNDDKSYLNLITCHGEWEDLKKSYSSRLVVFTDLVYR